MHNCRVVGQDNMTSCAYYLMSYAQSIIRKGEETIKTVVDEELFNVAPIEREALERVLLGAKDSRT